jgi:transposase InsO family protein
MDERARFVIEASQSTRSFAEICRRFNISRPTGHKWLERYRTEGLDGLADRSHRPRACPHATAQPVIDRILELRQQFQLGARKIQRLLRDEFDTVPCVDTIHDILKRHGCIEPHKPRRRRTHPGPPPTSMDHPNDVWSADFKGEFKTGDGRYCYPLTIQDGYSRFLLDCHALPRLDLKGTTRRFDHLFHTFGLPNRIRTDNGPPFASTALARLSQLSVHWIKLGIQPELIEPGKPYQNGRHERMHRTLGERTATPPARNLRGQQRRFNDFQTFYNTIRPHEGLGQQTPASFYEPSSRPLPSKPDPLTYPAHFEQRLVSQIGNIRWKKTVVHVSRLLAREYVALEATADAVWSVYFGPVHLGSRCGL